MKNSQSRYFTILVALLLFILSRAFALGQTQTIVFWQEAFPTVDSQPVSQATLRVALDALHPLFWGVGDLCVPAALDHTNLLVLPYGSAFPSSAWDAVATYLDRGGNLLVLGGSPFRVPVDTVSGNSFHRGQPSDRFAKSLGLTHAYQVEGSAAAGQFRWDSDFNFLPKVSLRAARVFALVGPVHGLGHIVNPDGDQVSAPVVAIDHTDIRDGQRFSGGRQVYLDFDPEKGYWESEDGGQLIRAAAEYAIQGAIRLSLDVQYSTIGPGTRPDVDVHIWQRGHPSTAYEPGEVNVTLASAGGQVLQRVAVKVGGPLQQIPLHFDQLNTPGYYTLRAVYSSAGKDRAVYQNGFWVDDGSLLRGGPKLEQGKDSLRLDGHAFLPVGTNYFTTEGNGWDLWGPRNASVWERDFSQMQKNGVRLVRTGIWWGHMRIVEPFTSEANERFLRNMQAYLLSAHHHGIAVDFTLFAFDPGTAMRSGTNPVVDGPGTNPYLDPAAVAEERNFVLSVVEHFKDVPWLCWDLINEPSFSNPHRVFHGNEPNRDAAEVSAWQNWLKTRYSTVGALAEAWSVDPGSLRDFGGVAIPSIAEYTFQPPLSASAVETMDYNLFAQYSFAKWVQAMVSVIRETGSQQLINVGQDEGGVNDRLLNQFYAGVGVSFTVNHTYWNNDQLLWDSFAAKRPGLPNIVGETGAVNRTDAHGDWEGGDEKQFARLESRMALGFAAGSSGALQWDWSRDRDLGMLRSDGSLRNWRGILKRLGDVAAEAERHWDGFRSPEIAIILPQSYQLSPYKSAALLAQSNATRALFQFAHLDAYAVGEYQTSQLGEPKLILLPSPQLLSDSAWSEILDRVRRGSTLLVSGPFDRDAHFFSTGRSGAVGLTYTESALDIHSSSVSWPTGTANFNFFGDKREFLQKAVLADDAFWLESTVGKGQILFTALPIEMSEDLEAVGRIYGYAAGRAGIHAIYRTELPDTGILISPSRLGDAILYVILSESNSQMVALRDLASGKRLCSHVDAGRAALVLLSTTGTVLKSYNWSQDERCGVAP